MNIQLALDRLSREECFDVIKETERYIDWIEVGTGVIKEYGMSIIREIKEAFPNKVLVADMKTCDAGRYEAAQAFEAGADITTVMAFSADKTILDTLEVARKQGKRVMIDLLGMTDPTRLEELEQLGVDLIGLHFGKDMQLEGEIHTDLFNLVESYSTFEVAIAGGINIGSLPDILEKSPNTIIVGSAISKAEDRTEVAKKMKGLINAYEVNY
ncbi:D-arabino-3-hexulose 6-phosphate formaldehyde lyase [Halalkalibacter wakoensis JCM 9140]|uniref:3-hexulose-6-phosphate synthase n=1 Tax=Halalkalibacter wakoensis JCM 9140 TaxID=1236970 RepID=W4Q9A0_9BACI|nr:3-hexulose-6-phosphate synthase [Halalkalibacter wakoensis]GAE28575.1 D-arabino-3-hexulose 6-phosphate formaldehyde lyase [Halalkalibacter wakoensis JCM 9140]